MATFRFKPSPFCVLDEVDAALDEANLFRFRQLLEHMSDQTQFILITHSKTTMEAAETLYGITMAEPGVSRLVSVRMPDNKAPAPPSERVAVTVGA
jgi:chromosome segregation protein